MIRAAAVAGAAAWTAPVIIDSLSSPAAAITTPTGCFFVSINASTCGFDDSNACASIPGCTRNDLLQPCVQVVSNGDCNGGVTVNNLCSTTCQFTAANASAGSNCYTPTQTDGGSISPNTIVFGATIGGVAINYSQYHIFITCGP